MSRQRLMSLAIMSVAVVTLASVVLPAVQAQAFSPNYNSSNLIDNPTFTDASTMSASVIQTFLNSLGSGIKNLTDVEACSSAIKPYYTHCGKRISAAQIIYDAAHAYGINPRAVLATLEKEQSLITDPSPSSSQINCAMGFNSCTNYVGFFTQVDNGVWDLRYNYEGAFHHATWLSWHPGNNYACANAQAGFYNNGLYPGNTVTFANSGGTAKTIKIANAATASLYCYTPYVGPYSETGYSGSYNFVYYFQLWFGSTQTSMQYAWNSVQQGGYTNSTRTQKFTRGNVDAVLTPGATAYMQVIVRNVGYQNWSPSIVHLGTDNPHDRCSTFFVASDTNWISCRRIAMQETNVVPGDTATFNFTITAPATVGSYREYFNVVADGVTWMNGPGMHFDIDVVQPNTPAATTYTLNSGQNLTTNQTLIAQDLHTALAMQPDGNTVLYVDGKAYWSTHTPGYKISKLAMQGDGNLVLYGTDNVAAWSSKTANNPGAHLVLQTDGNLVIYNSASTQALWSSGTPGVPANGLSYVVHALPGSSGTTTLYPMQQLQTANKAYRATFQGDGNFVLYSTQGAVWSSRTVGHTNTRIVLQGDGNMVIYDRDDKPLWASKTAGNPNDQLVLQSDGNMVIYSAGGAAIWSSGTAGKQ